MGRRRTSGEEEDWWGGGLVGRRTSGEEEDWWEELVVENWPQTSVWCTIGRGRLEKLEKVQETAQRYCIVTVRNLLSLEIIVTGKHNFFVQE